MIQNEASFLGLQRKLTPVKRASQDFRKTIEDVWEEKYKKAVFSVVVKVVFACYNLWFTFHTASYALERTSSGHVHHRWAFQKLYLAVGIEAIALSYYSCLCMINLSALFLHHKNHSSPQALQFVRALEMVGSFSYFMFLPGPKKLLYWYSNFHIAKEMYWTHPQLLRMTRQFTFGAKYFDPCDRQKVKFLWDNGFENFHCCQSRQQDPMCGRVIWCWKAVLTVVATFAWFLERFVNPCLTIVFIVFAVPAVILKLAMLPNLDPSVSTHELVNVILPYLGILLQSTRTWAIREIELCAVLRFDAVIHDGLEAAATAESINRRLMLLNIVYDAMIRHQSRFAAMCMVSLLDNALLAHILRKQYETNAPDQVAILIKTLKERPNHEEDDHSIARLAAMTLKQLKDEAHSKGFPPGTLDDLDDKPDPKHAAIELLMARPVEVGSSHDPWDADFSLGP